MVCEGGREKHTYVKTMTGDCNTFFLNWENFKRVVYLAHRSSLFSSSHNKSIREKHRLVLPRMQVVRNEPLTGDQHERIKSSLNK